MPEKTTDRIPGWQGGKGDAVGLGADLRVRREELGWALPDVAGWLRIRESYLQALEEGDSSVFPGNAYALGFLRTYAQALGMDPDQAVARFRQDTRGVVDRRPDLTFPEPVSERGVPVGLWVGVGLAVLVATYIGYYHFLGAEPAPTRQMPPVAEIMPGVTQHGTPSPQIAAVMPDRGQAPSPQTALSSTAGESKGAARIIVPTPPAGVQSNPVASGFAPAGTGDTSGQNVDVTQPPASMGAAPLQPGQMPSSPDLGDATGDSSSERQTGQQVQSGVQPQPGQPPAGAASDTSVSPARNIVLHAGADAWVQIRDKANATVFSRVLKSGEIWQGPESGAPYHMTLGNAGGLTLSAGDVTTAPLGRFGAVRRNLVVDADAIRNGTLGQGSVPVPPPAQSVPVPVTDPTAPVATQPPVSVAARPLKKQESRPKISVSPGESETDRLNARQLEQTAQPH